MRGCGVRESRGDGYADDKYVVVFGGTGFVGSNVIRSAILSDPLIKIICITRRGLAPAWLSDSVWGKAFVDGGRVHYEPGDLLDVLSIHAVLEKFGARNIVGVVSCVGCITPFDRDLMYRTCGTANCNAYDVYRKYGIGKFAVITRDLSNMDDWWYPFPLLIPTYYLGKKLIEAKVVEDGAADPSKLGRAVCFRAGFVCGTRHTLPGMPTSIKLALPLDLLCGCVNKIVPTIKVEVLSDSVVRFVLSEAKSDRTIVLNEDIERFFEETEK